MTKCNKILLCAMLAVVMTLACALTVLPVAHPTTANAAGEVKDATFLLQDLAQKVDEPISSFSIVDTEGKYTIAVTGKTAYSSTNGDGIRLGASKSTGSISFTVPANIVLVKIKVALYNNDSSVYVVVNGVKTTETIDNNNVISVDTSETKTITFATSAQKKRCVVESIEFYVEESISTPVSVQINGEERTSYIEEGQYSVLVTTVNSVFVKGGEYKVTFAYIADKYVVTLKVNNQLVDLQSDTTYTGTIGDEDVLIIETSATYLEDHTHSLETLISAQDPTCTEDGWAAYYKCTCGQYFDADKNETTWEELKVEATGHDCLYTANNDGTHKVTCTRCDYVVESEDCTYVEDATTCSKCNAEKPAKPTFEIVTDASTLKVGDKLLIVSVSKKVAAGDISNKIMLEEAVIIENEIITDSKNAIVLQLGGASGAWTLANAEGKLLGATKVKELAWDSGTTTWNITIGSDGNATIQNTTQSYGRFLHNSGSNRFTTYTSVANTSMLLPQLYKLEVAHTHTEENMTAVDEQPADCGNTGVAAHYKCNICGKSFVKSGEEFVEADITKTVENGGLLISKNGNHAYGEEIAEVSATCTATGIAAHYECGTCGKLFTKNEDDTYTEVAEDKLVVAKISHNFENGVCTMCNHTPDEIVVLEAYKLAVGESMSGTQVLTGVIKRIDDAYSTEYKNVTVTIQVGKLEEKMIKCFRLVGGQELIVGDTITVTGTIKNYNSTIEFDKGCTYVLAEHLHTAGRMTKHDAVEATCTTNGNVEYHTCSICGEEKCYDLVDEQYVLRTEAVTIAASGHTEVIDVAVEATCTETGLTEGKHCSVCNATIVEQQTTDALGHNFHGEETVVTPATCGTDGSKTVKCTRCNETETQTIAATGEHTWTEVVADQYKVEGTENTYHKSCSVCHTAGTETFTTTVSQGFEVTTVIEADSGVSVSEDGKTYYLVAGNTITVQYVITANSGINGLEATIRHDSRFTCTNVVAGDAFGEANTTITKTADFNGVVKIAVTAGNQATSQGVLVTVTYTLNNGVTDLADLTFGLDLKVVVGDGFMDNNLVKVTADAEHTLALRESTSVSIGKNELTYNGQLVTVGTEDTTIIVTSDNKGTLTYTWKKNGEVVAEVKDAGTYQLTVSITGDPAHADAYGTFTVTINSYEIVADNITIALADTNAKTLYTGSAEWGVNDLTVAYNGADLPDKFEGLYELAFANNTILATDKPLSKEMSVTLTITKGNYVLSAEKVVNLTITATLTGIEINGVPDATTKDYDKVAIDLSAITCNPTSNVTLTITVNGSEVSGEALKTAILNAGEYNVVVTASGTGYTTATIERTYTINAKELTHIEFKYAQNVATWINTTTNGDEIAVTYKVGETTLTENKVVAVGVGAITIIVETTDTNYKGYTISTVAAVSVKFVDNKFNTTTNTQYTFVRQMTTAPEAPTHGGWEFKYWYLTDEKTKFDFDKDIVEADITLNAYWKEIINNVKLTIEYYYNGNKVDTKTVENIEGYTELSGIKMPEAVKATWLSLDGYYTDKEFGTKFAKMPNANLTVYAKYDFAAGSGDIDGDKTVGNNDIMLYRMYIVGGYDIEVIGIGDEYTAAVLYADDTETKFFFKAVANVNGDKTTEGEIQTDVYDIRDAAVLAMAMVNANGYGVSEDNTHITTPSTNASASTSTQAVQYALLPTGKYAA